MTSPHPSDQEGDALTRKVELFRRHSHRLSQVASHAAQSSADSKRELYFKEMDSGSDGALCSSRNNEWLHISPTVLVI